MHGRSCKKVSAVGPVWQGQGCTLYFSTSWAFSAARRSTLRATSTRRQPASTRPSRIQNRFLCLLVSTSNPNRSEHHQQQVICGPPCSANRQAHASPIPLLAPARLVPERQAVVPVVSRPCCAAAHVRCRACPLRVCPLRLHTQSLVIQDARHQCDCTDLLSRLFALGCCVASTAATPFVFAGSSQMIKDQQVEANCRVVSAEVSTPTNTSCQPQHELRPNAEQRQLRADGKESHLREGVTTHSYQ